MQELAVVIYIWTYSPMTSPNYCAHGQKAPGQVWVWSTGMLNKSAWYSAMGPC